MLQHPRLKYCYNAEFLDDGKVLLLSEKENVLLTGKLFTRVLSELQHNSRSVDELSAALEGKISALELYYALDVLERKGYLTEAAPSQPQETCAYWNSLGMEMPALLKALQDNTVVLESLAPLAHDLFRQTFNRLGIQTGETGNLRVVIADDYGRKELARINQEAMETGQPWMLVKPVGVEVWIGPLFLPGKTGCWQCLKQRLDMNRPMNTFYKLHTQTDSVPPAPMGQIPLSSQIAANQTALEITKWLYWGNNERLEGQLVTFDTGTLTSQAHVLVKRPQCPACGQPEKPLEPKPVILKRSASYCVTSMGGYREVSPEDTVEKYRHHVSPISGVVQTLRPYFSIPGAPVYNYTSGRNIALRSKTLLELNNHVRSGNGGKGKTWSQAKAGALCEAIERYSGTYQGGEPSIVGSLEKLGRDGIHPNACMNYSEKQYQHREARNRACSKFYALIPVPFDASLDMPWTPVYSLTEQTFKYLPSCFCYAQYPAENEEYLFAYPDSNGGAAGNSLEEAILQGFLELVERDSVALWWYNMLRKPAVDLHSFHEPYFLQLIDYYTSLHRSLYVLDLTTDLQIPAFGAISHRTDDDKPDIVFGFGAHVDAKIAVERALVELNQLLPIANVPESDRAQGKYRIDDKSFLLWLKTAAMENRPYLVPLDNMPKKTASDYPQLCKPNIYDSVMCCLDSATKHGLETLVLDLTRPDIGLPVTKVIVPGLRHFWQRLAPGRLYDVPVKMGWLEAPLKEEELNPIALFI